MNSNSLEQEAKLIEDAFFRNLNELTQPPPGALQFNEASEIHATLVVEGDPEEEVVIRYLKTEDLIDALNTGLLSGVASALLDPTASAIGVVCALARCGAIFKKSLTIRSNRARVFDVFLNHPPGQEITCQELAEETGLSMSAVETHCKVLFSWGLIVPEENGYSFEDRFRLRVPASLWRPFKKREAEPAELEEERNEEGHEDF